MLFKLAVLSTLRDSLMLMLVRVALAAIEIAGRELKLTAGERMALRERVNRALPAEA